MSNRKLTVRENPPAKDRSTKWTAIAEECRQDPNQWHKIVEPFKTKNVAQQLSSNIRSSHRRKKTVNGFNRNEKWSAVWAESEKQSGTFHVWLRYEGSAE